MKSQEVTQWMPFWKSVRMGGYQNSNLMEPKNTPVSEPFPSPRLNQFIRANFFPCRISGTTRQPVCKKWIPMDISVHHYVSAYLVYASSFCLTHSVKACRAHDRPRCVACCHCCGEDLGRRPSKCRSEITKVGGRAVASAQRWIAGIECWGQSCKDGRGNPGWFVGQHAI